MLSQQSQCIQPAHIARGIEIADNFDAMQHDPCNPFVAASYRQFMTEVLSQYGYIVHTLCITVEPWFNTDGEPYKMSRQMIADVKRQHLFVLPTINAFGSEQKFTDNPLLELTDYVISGYRLCINDCFRVVHDVLGHARNNNPFGPLGEEGAWRDHLPWFSLLARPALATETRGQSSWFFYGAHLRNEHGRVPQPNDTGFVPYHQRPFTEQKIGLLPPDVSGVELTQTEAGIIARLYNKQSGREPIADKIH